jgi:hypothetical protein
MTGPSEIAVELFYKANGPGAATGYLPVSRITGQVLLFGLRVFKEPGVEAQELQKSGQAVTLKVFDIPKGILH